MSRWHTESVFYKVVFVSMLAVGVIFSLVLTDVFLDIDGLLHDRKDKIPVTKHKVENHEEFITTDKYNTEDNGVDNSFRTKRSSEYENLFYHLKQTKMRNMLTNRLSSLLDQLDNEQTTVANNKMGKIIDATEDNKQFKEQEETQKKDEKERFLHSALHEILLLALKGHMDFNEVYQRVHQLTDNFEKTNPDAEDIKQRSNKESTKEDMTHPTDSTNGEKKILDELLNCKKLKSDIAGNAVDIDKDSRRTHGPNIIIKTIIDINSLMDGKKHVDNETNTKEVKGLVKLIYNGKSIKFTRLDDEVSNNKENSPKLDVESVSTEKPLNYDEITDLLSRTSKTKANDIIKEYLNQYSNIKTKRLKRHIKIRYDNDEITEKPKMKKEEDELLVEIETHFDSKGMKGDKKKKLISNLVEKIQKAIHSSSDKKDLRVNETLKYDGRKKHKHIHVKKRTQNPLNFILKNKMLIPVDSMTHRHMDPIAKAVPLQEPMPYVSDKHGEDWQRKLFGPAFLGVGKSINSAELSQVDVDYDTANANGVLQRVQRPLNDDTTLKDDSPNVYYDLGKLKFFVKDIAGSGFSVGFNQYVDEQPDPEAMKLFTGIENIIQTYHQTYDQPDQAENEVDTEKAGEIRDENEETYHTISRRSIDESDHHSNEYKNIFENLRLPYENYEDIFNENRMPDHNRNDKRKVNTIKNDVKSKGPFVFDESVLDKELKPSEIFSIANLLERRKRSISIQKITNLKKKIKLNRYLNTKAMATKPIFLSKRRNKRHAENIRIIANSNMPMHKHSDEIFVVSDENVLADRAMVREVETPEIEPEIVAEDHYDIIQPQTNNPHMTPIQRMPPMPPVPYAYEEPIDQPLVTNIFDGRSRHNSLMSKYPHILLEDIGRSREEDIIENPIVFNKYVEESPVQVPAEATTTPASTISHVPEPKMEEIVKAITPLNAKTNYRVTVKILPKNVTGVNSGFKEVHTSINKSYNRNGLLYSSLVNVSEISKIVKINKTLENTLPTTTQSPVFTNFRRQQETMNYILKQHKHRIEEQLKHLHREKQKLENLSIKNETEFDYGNQNEFFEVVVPSNPPKVIKLTKDEMSRLAVASLVKIDEETRPTPATITTPFTTEVTELTTEKIPTSKMEQNENITKEILKKIDKNTEILQLFLQKLTDKIIGNVATDKIKEDFENIPNLKSIPAPFDRVMPNMVATNDSHLSIPFIYAYQQPYTLPANKPDTPVASVVYHGHIHTNTINRNEWPDKGQKKVKEDRTVNQTKFFIDELENSYIAADVKKGFANLSNSTVV